VKHDEEHAVPTVDRDVVVVIVVLLLMIIIAGTTGIIRCAVAGVVRTDDETIDTDPREFRGVETVGIFVEETLAEERNDVDEDVVMDGR